MIAEEFFKNNSRFRNDNVVSDMTNIMIEFAKYHVQKALEAQAKLAKRCIVNNSPVPSKDFLKKVYPLENIK